MADIIIVAYVQIVRTNHIFPLHMDEISILCNCFDQFIVIFQQVLVYLGKYSNSIYEAWAWMSAKKRALICGYTHALYADEAGTRILAQGSFQQVSETYWSVITKHWLLLAVLEEVPGSLKLS